MKSFSVAGVAFAVAALLAGATFGNTRNMQMSAPWPVPEAADASVWHATAREQSFTAYITGYSYWDNTPPGSAAIARPVIHQRAGGSGTYRDPITIAVGYRLVGGRAKLDFPAGTRFYLPHLQRYAIVEDICGDGPNPDVTGCHRGKQGRPWLDIYVDGSRVGPDAANACMYRLTGFNTIIMNPGKGYPVTPSPIAESGCATPGS